eukprot:Phypoly_transcript_02678.p1 GENE.Phypoly_transcript_02678~~Phypoly_transcript_02678.p1  ORF type:complete len:822 (+),score=110.18 Phypoly_transcript_02678:190-2655(+)
MIQQVHQGHLEKLVRDIFPNENIKCNVRKEASIVNPETSRFVELDVWIPDLSIGFEFQDAHHYSTTWYYQSSLSVAKERDNAKAEIAHLQGITFIQIPCWWPLTHQNLLATILFHRPDLKFNATRDYPKEIPNSPPDSRPISLNIPADLVVSAFCVSGVGELMLAQFTYTPKQFANAISHDNFWWLGEKYDGVRCVWNPNDKILYSRRGIELPMHEDENLFPTNTFLDAELWYGRGFYQESQRLFSSPNPELSFLRIITFDNAAPTRHNAAFEERYNDLLGSVPYGHQFIIIAARLRGYNKKLISFVLDNIMEDGGEGVIMRRHNSTYEPGRSENLVKIKTTPGDAEGLVLELLVKSAVIKLPNDTQIEVELGDMANLQGLKIGDVVTFGFDSYSRRDVPSNPTLLRIRTDLTWEQALLDYSLNPQPSILNGSSQPFTTKPLGFWTIDDNKNLRKLFEDFARNLNLDPLSAATWYSVPRSLFVQTHGKAVLTHKGGYIKTIMSLFPDIGLREENFATFPKEHWESVKNRKRFFNEFAREQHFDPKLAKNWYSVSRDNVLAKKGAKTVLAHYGGSMARALIHLYPYIGLSKKNLGFWRDSNNKRIFFDEYARNKGFDPLLAENWYSLDSKDLRSFSKDITDILELHENSIVQTLIAVYPSIGLGKTKFRNLKKSPNFWTKLDRRREFFDNIARQRGLDPLLSSTWYSLSKEIIRSHKGGAAVVGYYGGFIEALQQLYPELHLEIAKFSTVPAGYWKDKNNRKGFFDSFAREHRFDPLSAHNWRSVSKQQLTSSKGYGSIMSWYKGSLARALLDVYDLELQVK